MDLDLDAKKYFVTRYTALGMSLDEACQKARVQGLERRVIEGDEAFMASLPSSKPLSFKIRDVLSLIASSHINYEQAFIVCDLTPDEAEFLRSDDGFMADVARIRAQLEKNLINGIHECSLENLDRGISTEARWLAEKLFPERYGSRVAVSTDVPLIPEPVAVER